MGTILSCESVIKQYRQYDTVVTAVNRANFTVQDKEFVAIIGASGSGKSTLLQICAGLDVPNSEPFPRQLHWIHISETQSDTAVHRSREYSHSDCDVQQT